MDIDKVMRAGSYEYLGYTYYMFIIAYSPICGCTKSYKTAVRDCKLYYIHGYQYENNVYPDIGMFVDKIINLYIDTELIFAKYRFALDGIMNNYYNNYNNYICAGLNADIVSYIMQILRELHSYDIYLLSGNYGKKYMYKIKSDVNIINLITPVNDVANIVKQYYAILNIQ